MGKNRRIEGHKKVKEDEFDHNVNAPQKSVQNYEADEYEENGESRMIKIVEKFECCMHYEPKQSKENQTNLSVKLENHCDKLENLSESRYYRIKESKKNEGHSKVKVDEFGHNVEEPPESVQNYESYQYEGNEYEENCKSMLIKVEKFEFSDDILPDIAVEHFEPEDSIENHTKVSVKLEHRCAELENLSESKNYQIEESKRNKCSKVKVNKFGHNVEELQESANNHESIQFERNEKGMLIKVELFECNDDILPQIGVEHYDREQSKENQTKVSVKLEHHWEKVENLTESKLYPVDESKRNEGHSKVKIDKFGHNDGEPQESAHNHESNQYEGNEKGMLIKVEKFECSDDILPQIAVEHYDREQSKEDQSKVSVNLENHCDKLENLLVSKNYQIEESKRNEGHSKVKVDKFGLNVEEPQESAHNRESDQYEGDEKGMLIKVEKFECSDDILPQIAVEHCEPEQSLENQTNVLVKLERHCNKLSQISQVSLNQPEKYKGNQENKDSTTIVASAVYEVSDDSNSSTKRISKQARRGGNRSHKVLNKIYAYDNISDNCEDTVHSELSHDDDSISVIIETSKVLSPDLQCYVALEKLSYKCEICKYVTVIKELLVSHMKLHDYKQSDSISECELQLKNQIISEKYEHKQLTDKLFACNLCSYKSAHKSHLKSHQLTHTGEKPFACTLCSYKCALKSSLQKHQRTHTGEKPFACNLCSYKCALKSILKKHQRTHTGEKPFACNLCSYKCALKSSLQKHQRTHTGEKPFACNLCSYKCALKSILKKHQRTHTGEKPFACNLCSYKFALKSTLKRHQLIHTGEKSFACNLCSYKCALKLNLVKHQLTHTGDKPFACNLCSYKCALKSSLQKHQLTHTGEKPFACNLCSYKSAQKSNLKRHQLKHCSQQRDRHAAVGLSVQYS